MINNDCSLIFKAKDIQEIKMIDALQKVRQTSPQSGDKRCLSSYFTFRSIS
jgi:hypothetical protein